MRKANKKTTQNHNFTFIVPEKTWEKVADLRKTIEDALTSSTLAGTIGTELIAQLKKANITSEEQAASLTNERLMQLLLKTKKARCFAETEVGSGNWTDVEFAILSAITTSVPVTMFADAKWGKGHADSYTEPQQGHLFFTNGPVLDPNSPISQSPNSEYYQLTKPENGQRVLDQDKYKAFFRQRLLPIFKEAQKKAAPQGKTPFVSIPGIGVGLFAGAFANQLKDSNGDGAFKDAVYAVLNELTKEEFSGVVRIDMGPAHKNNKKVTIETNGVRVYEHDQGADELGLRGPGILALPSTLGITTAETLRDDQFLHCSVVAGDPTSYPGNDMHEDSSNTNEGAVGGSTNVVGLTIGEAGKWNEHAKEYHPTQIAVWEGHNKPFVGAENPEFITVSIPKKMAADGTQKQTREEATTTKKATPSQKDLRLTKQGRAIVIILSLLTLGLYPLARYLRSLVTGKPFSWGLPDSMHASRPLQVPTSSSAVAAKETEPRSLGSKSNNRKSPRACLLSLFSRSPDSCGLEESTSKCQK